MPGGVRPYHAVTLPTTFDEYLKKFNSKSATPATAAQLLEKPGPLHFEAIQRPEEVTTFFEAATKIAHQSWQFAAMGRHAVTTLEEIADLAKATFSDRTCSWPATSLRPVVGYQYWDIYYYARVGYDQTYAAASRGTGRLYVLIKDLIENTSARRLSFDYGDAGYKREFCNVHAEDATVLLLRKTLSNRLRRHVHGAFGSMVQGLKSWLRRRPNGAAH